MLSVGHHSVETDPEVSQMIRFLTTIPLRCDCWHRCACALLSRVYRYVCALYALMRDPVSYISTFEILFYNFDSAFLAARYVFLKTYQKQAETNGIENAKATKFVCSLFTYSPMCWQRLDKPCSPMTTNSTRHSPVWPFIAWHGLLIWYFYFLRSDSYLR